MRLSAARASRFLPLAAILALAAQPSCSRDNGKKGSGGDETTAEAQPPVSTDPQPQDDQEDIGPDTPVLPKKDGKVSIPSGRLPLPKDNSDKVELPTGQYVAIDTVAGIQYISIEATLEDASFKRAAMIAKARAVTESEYVARIAVPLNETISKLSAQIDGGLTLVKTYPTIGFFTAKMRLSAYDSLAEVKGLPANIVLNPVVVTPLDDRLVRRMDKTLSDAVKDGRRNNDAFSGLRRMGVPEFLESVKAELNTTPDGSNVLVGVTDTGITYNHPTFNDASGKNRIVYMKDFTAEGRIYVNPAAKFEVTVPESNDGVTLNLKAEVIAPVKGAQAKPLADDFVPIEAPISVSAELRSLLTTAGSGAKLGAMSEESFATDSEFVDLNLNGKTKDIMFVIVVPAAEGEGYELYFDPSGELDFRKAKPVRSFNSTGDTVKLGMERFGFDIAATKLKNKANEETDVIGASIVGFDPGNHGSHVTGIIAGIKTIANDKADTLARGAAPNAPLMMNRVCANNGGCAATDAIIDLSMNGAEIINMSLGGLSPFNDGYDVQEIIIDRLTEVNNTLFVISAGNSGPGINTVGSPSTARHALSVGAAASRELIERQYQWPGKGKPGALSRYDSSEDNDFMLFFSSRGPTAAGGFKPDVSAPGTELSAIQLNAASGARAGLDVYWGTSMAAPAAAGAIALLIDTAKIYNKLHPENPLPLDALTLRKVVVNSARPFDVTRFDPASKSFTRGQYTWIDQGTGMINLPRAWEALKAARDSKLPSAVAAVTEAGREDIALDYQIRVLKTGPNGIPYDGSLELPADMFRLSGPRFGRGVWLDMNSSENLVKVQVARRLPYKATLRPDAADLKRQLLTTADEFEIRTVVYGSNKEWLKAGTLNQLDCKNSPAANLTLIGEAAVDQFDSTAGNGTSISTNDSTMMLCLDRATMNALPAGDHGVLIFAHRKSGDKVESIPSFIVPVYVSVPHKTLAGEAGFEKNGKVLSFGVDRNYVEVPEGVNLVTVKLEVPEAAVRGNVVKGCAGVRLYAYEAGNTSLPAEISGLKSIARNCDDAGNPSPESRTVTYTRSNPKPGIWNLHVFGRYQFPESDYKLTVEFARVKTSVAQVAGGPEALDGSLEFEILEASFDATPSAERSAMVLNRLAQDNTAKVATDGDVIVPDLDGNIARQYDAGTVQVGFATGGSPGNDIDLFVLECASAEGEDCALIGSSTTATDVELVQITPQTAKFYLVLVLGYDVSQGDGSFKLTESRYLSGAETGTVSVESLSETSYRIGYEFDQDSSELLKNQLFLSGKFRLEGDIRINTATGALMLRIPVLVTAPEQVQ